MLDREWLKAFVPVGTLDDAQTLTVAGAGILLAEPPVVWLVTAGHVILKAAGRPIAAVVSARDGGPALVNLTQIHGEHGLKWHVDRKNDVAAGLMPFNEAWIFRAVSEEFCLPFDQVTPSLPCYTLGCPYGVVNLDTAGPVPLVLDGIVSGLDSKGRRIYTNAPTFPGNSGGPLLVVKLPYNWAGGMTVGQQVLHLAGIVVEVVLVPDPQGVRPPLHLGLAVSMDAVWELIRSNDVREEYNRIAAAHAAAPPHQPET